MAGLPQHPLVVARERQREQALALGNMKRAKMAALKKGIKARELDGVRILLGHGEEWQDALDMLQVGQFIMSFPRIGVTTRDEILDEMDLSGTTRMQHLNTNERIALARLINVVQGGSSY